MPPIETPDVQSADSSPAIEVPRDPAEYAKWRQTGELPKAASTPAKETPASQEGTTAPASETGNSNQEKGKKSAAAQRLEEVLADIKRAGLTPEELKTFKREQKQQQAESPSAASEKTANPAELKAPVRPVKKDYFEGGKYATYEEAEAAFDAAREKYVDDVLDYKDSLRTQAAQQQATQRAVHEKITEAVERYGKEAGEIISATSRAFYELKDGSPSPIVPPAVISILNDSPVWPDVLYTLGSKPEELAGFIALAKSDPGAAIRKAIVIEQLVTAELAKGGKQTAAVAGEGDSTPRGEDGKFKKTPPEKQESQAPPPPKEVSGRGTPPGDEVEQALKSNDVRTAMRAMNERDVSRRRGR